jgi:hypothetical protein
MRLVRRRLEHAPSLAASPECRECACLDRLQQDPGHGQNCAGLVLVGNQARDGVRQRLAVAACVNIRGCAVTRH